ncbi:MAG: 2-oxoacid:ferredoxin oxidoreductase subunit beta [Flavobacteriales bacterium]|nr:2-oxoacid:ferredoxin oxidoreductase subunit beta [Flavobacteriales bacterium]
MENLGGTCALVAKDFESDQAIKWCPGCGDYVIIKAVQKALADLGLSKEETVFVAGIGCSSRFPYYMDTYGFHTIHGRGAAVATGVKIANPKLSVWLASGDGDSMAIGGNHFIHSIRRNVDMNVILFNNEIYGLTKGQYSPTSKRGIVTKSSPHGTIEDPFSPGELALGSGSNFFARVPDSNIKLLTEVFVASEKHRGLSLVEVLQNCVIFNDKVHEHITSKETRDDNQLILQHGEAMIFGKEKNKGLVLDGLSLKVVTIGENGVSESDILVHDATTENKTLHIMLASMKGPDFPIAMGVIRNVAAPTYDNSLHEQIKSQAGKFSSLDEMFMSGNVFEVK